MAAKDHLSHDQMPLFHYDPEEDPVAKARSTEAMKELVVWMKHPKGRLGKVPYERGWAEAKGVDLNAEWT